MNPIYKKPTDRRFAEERNPADNQGGMPPQKPWMGEDVYMVAFLLSVEVERLRDECSQYVQYIELHESRNKGLDMIEGELQQARLKMGDYEKRIALLQNEAEQWKLKAHQKDRESEDQRYQNELARRVALDREIMDLTAKFISDKNALDNENQKLRNELTELKLKRGSIDDVLYSAEAIQNENMRLKEELNKLRKGFDELEYVLKTASELEIENQELKQELLARPHNGNSAELLIQLQQENHLLKQQLDSKSQAQPNQQRDPTVLRLQGELRRYQEENMTLRNKLGLQGGVSRHTDNFWA